MKHVKRIYSFSVCVKPATLSLAMITISACGGGDSSSGAGSTNVPGNVNQAAVGTYQGTTCATLSPARQSVKQQEPVRQCMPSTTQINANGRLLGGTAAAAPGGVGCTNPQPPTFVNGTTISNNDSFTCIILGDTCNFERSINGTAANQTLNIRVSGSVNCVATGNFTFVGTVNAQQQRAKALLQSPEGLNDSDLYINLIEQLL